MCRKCGWPFPNSHPSPRHRRAHKKICGSIEGYKLVGSAQLSVSDDDQHSDDDPKTPSEFVHQLFLCSVSIFVSALWRE